MKHDVDGEVRLWQHVILRAVMDAGSADETRVGFDGLPYGAVQARSWILKAGPDFRMVCALAGWDPDFVSKAFREGRLTAESLWPADSKKIAAE